MANELERLLLRFEADTAALRSALKDMDSKVDASERNVARKLSNVENRFKTMGTNVKTAMATAGLAVGLSQIASFASEISQRAGNIEEMARAVGLTTQRYQELGASARDAGLQQAQFDQAMLKFATSVSEARQMTGGFYEFLRGRAPDLLKDIQNSQNLGEAYLAVADKVRGLSDAEDRALVVKQAFGDGAIRLTNALEGGSVAIDAAAAAAHRYGRIMNDESIKVTAEYEREIKKLGDTFYNSAVNGVGSFIQWIKKLDGRLEEQRQGLGRTGDWLKSLFAGSKPEETTAEFFDRLESAQKGGWQRIEALAIGSWQTTVQKASKLPVDPKKLLPGADAINQLRLQAAEASGRALEAIDMQYAMEIEKFKRMLDDKIINEKQFAEARALIGETMGSRIAAEYEKETELVRELANEFKSGLGNSVNSVFDSIIQGSFRAQDAIRNLASELARMSMNRAVTQPLMDALFGTSGKGGSLTGSLSSLFGAGASNGGGWLTSIIPQMAHGGPMTAGRPYIAGEAGPELIVPNTAAQVMPGWAMSGGGGSSVVYNIDARNADAGVEQRIMAAIAKAERERPSPLSTARTFSQRFPTRR